MKTFIVASLVLLSLVGFGQQKTDPKNWKSLYYFDSTLVDGDIGQLYFDLNKIESMRVERFQDAINEVNGKIFIKTKDPKAFQFLVVRLL